MSRQRYDMTIPSLPEEMVGEILARIPVESLLRFRCASKSLRSLIDSKPFIKIHHQNSRKNQSFPHQWLILHHTHLRHCSLQSLYSQPSIVPPPLNNLPNLPFKPYKVVGCCNGLVCILDLTDNLFLWNPSTRISRMLPRMPYYMTILVKSLGFGYVESSDEFKVFGIRKRYRESIVYSSKTDSWKTIGKWHLGFAKCKAPVFVGGRLYWKRKSDLVFVDLKSEEFGSVELPPNRELSVYYGMGELGGCLCMLDHNFSEQRSVRVWVMKEYGVKDYSWERVVSLASVLELLRRPLSAPFTVGRNGGIFMFCGTTFLIYYPQYDVFCFPSIYYGGSQHVYVESLVSPLLLKST